jgi:hypothetical protein
MYVAENPDKQTPWKENALKSYIHTLLKEIVLMLPYAVDQKV